MPKQRNDAGRYVETATLDDVMGVFDAVAGPPVVTTADVADETGLSRDSARRKLETLHDRGRVEKRKSAGRVLYWPTDASTDSESGRERDETRREDTIDQTDAPTTSATAPAHTDRESSDAPTLDEVLADWRPGRSPGEKREQQRAAGRATLEYLRDHGSATAAEFRERVEPDNPVEDQSPKTWWKRTAREALQRARDAGLVTFKDGVKEWRYTPDSEQ